MYGNSLKNKNFTEPDENDLKKNFRLVIDESIKDNRLGYCHLYKDGKKISDTLFRKGGMSRGFEKSDYCMLIVYHDINKSTLGNHCIINLKGDIVLESTMLKPIYHVKGIIAYMGDCYYNLLNQEIIIKGTNHVTSESYVFVENQYNSEYEKGVYKIEYSTGNFEIFQ